MKQHLLLVVTGLLFTLPLAAKEATIDTFPATRCVRNACDTLEPIDQTIFIVSGSCNQPVCSYTMLTGASGCADVTAQPQVTSPSVQFAMPGPVLQGVNMYDAYLIRQYVLGIEPLKSWQLIAADINETGSVTTLDIVHLRQIILGLESLPETHNWQLLDADFLTDFSNPFNAMFNNAHTDMDRIDAVKIGDLNCSVVHADLLIGDTVFFTVDDQALTAGQPFEAVFRLEAAGTWAAMQFQVDLGVNMNATDLVPHNVPGLEDGSFSIFGHEVNIVWLDPLLNNYQFSAGEPMFTLQVTPNISGNLSEFATIEQMNLFTPSGAYDLDGNEHPIALRFTTGSATHESPNPYFDVETYPNPASGAAWLRWNNTELRELTLSLRDANGREIWGDQKTMPIGSVQWEIPEHALAIPGVYFWHISDGMHARQGKIMAQPR